jgi:cytoskeletal protein CcmA (bactofilin family)
MRVEGSVEGEVVISGGLTIEDGASVSGDVGASSLVVAGALDGDVSTRGPVAIRATAKVEGNMGAAEVSIEEGATFAGRIEADVDLPEELRLPPPAGTPPRGR